MAWKRMLLASRMLRYSHRIVSRGTSVGGRHEKVTLRFARADERDTALVDIEAWDYRPLKPGEADSSTWVVLERGVERIAWWWLQWLAPGCAVLHMCARPGARSINRHTLRGFAWVAELFGAKKLYAAPPAGDATIGYLRRGARWGWHEVREGVFLLEV